MFGLSQKENRKDRVMAEAGGKIPEVVSGSFDLLKRPVVSEKALGLGSKGEYVFRVVGRATKPEVKKEVERKYNVKVARVNMVVVKPRSKIFRGRVGSQTGFKKALVKLAAGQKIEVLSK